MINLLATTSMYVMMSRFMPIRWHGNASQMNSLFADTTFLNEAMHDNTGQLILKHAIATKQVDSACKPWAKGDNSTQKRGG